MSESTSQVPLPLSGVTILELAGLHPGPHASLLLSQFGADVIKVERPPGGDGTRAIGPHVFESLNRNKRSVVIDLKSKSGREAIAELMSASDVMVEGFRPGVADRLGVSYGHAKRRNPRLVYCSITSFGQSGPYRLRTGHDLNYLSLGGYFAAPSQIRDHTPARPKLRLADYAASMYAALSISNALLLARETGEGSYLDVSIHDAISAWCLPNALSMRDGHYSGLEDAPSVMPDNDIFPCADGRYISLGIFENKYWAELVEVLGVDFPEITDPDLFERSRRMARKVEVYERLERIFLSKSLASWVSLFEKTGVPWSTLYERDEVLYDPHLIERELYARRRKADGHEWTDIRMPVLFNNMRLWSKKPAPTLGEHTEQILRAFQKR